MNMKMNSVVNATLLAVFLFTGFLSQGMPVCASSEHKDGAPAKKASHKGRYWYFIDNVSYSYKDQERSILLWVSLPQDRPGQKVKVTNISPEPRELITEPQTGNKVVFWKIDSPEQGTNLVFRYDIEVENSPVVNSIDDSKIRKDGEELKKLSRWTVSEPWIEITPAIAAKAREIAGREENPYRQAKLIFEWIVENMHYEYPSMEDRGASKSFTRMKGDCGEFSHVFTAMMRSLGVPARSVTANWYVGSGHAWAEIYISPYGWIPVDTSVAQLAQNGLKGQMSEAKIHEFMNMCGLTTRDPLFLFGNLYPNRLEVFTGDNVRFRSEKTGVERTFTFMQPGGDSAWPHAIELNGLSGKTVHGGLYLFEAGWMDEECAREHIIEQMAPQYMAAKMYDKAIPLLEKVAGRSPEKSSAHFMLGQAYFNKGLYNNAVESFQRSIAGEGGSTKPVTDAWSRIFLGMSYDAMNMREKALCEYQKAIDSGVDNNGSLDLAKKLLKEPYKKKQ